MANWNALEAPSIRSASEHVPEVRLSRAERTSLLLLVTNPRARLTPQVRMKLFAKGLARPSGGDGDVLTSKGEAAIATRAWIIEGRHPKEALWHWRNLGEQLAYLDRNQAQRDFHSLVGPHWKADDLRIVEVPVSELTDRARRLLGISR
jgi:hypothetical protein